MAKKNDFDSRLNDIVSEHVSQLVSAIAAAVRQNMAEELSAYLASGGGNIAALRRLRPKKKRILPCIAPGCGNPSKGPRFHYLCEKHREAPRKEWEAWQKAKREAAA